MTATKPSRNFQGGPGTAQPDPTVAGPSDGGVIPPSGPVSVENPFADAFPSAVWDPVSPVIGTTPFMQWAHLLGATERQGTDFATAFDHADGSGHLTIAAHALHASAGRFSGALP